MSQKISVFVPGEPKAQPRASAFARRMGDKFVARVYTKNTAEFWKSQVALAFQGLPPVKYSGPVALRMEFVFQRPKTHYRRDGMTLAKGYSLEHLAAPDFDNLAKAVCDALTHLHVWEDDKQVIAAAVSKRYSKPGVLEEGMHLEVVFLEPREVPKDLFGARELSPAEASRAVSQAFADLGF